MASIDLTLHDILVPDIPEYTPPVGTKVTTTPTNKGGLSTRQVNDNILAPWTKRRPVTVTEDSFTGTVEYDANIRLVPDGEAITLTLGNATYDGCEVTVSNTGDTACVIAGTFGVSGRTYYLSAGKQRVFVWLTNKWIEYSAGGGNGNGVAFIGTRAAYNTAKLIPEGQDGYIPSGAIVVLTDEDELIIGEDE